MNQVLRSVRNRVSNLRQTARTAVREPTLEEKLGAQFDAIRAPEQERLYDNIMGCIASFPISPWGVGDYYEFGVFGAGYFKEALRKAEKWNLTTMDFFAFDSFEGLPPPHVGHLAMTEERFMNAIRTQGINIDRVRTIPGFFDKSLTQELQKEFVERKRPAAFINIDCDLHESAEPVFHFIEPLIAEGTFIYVDDFHSTFKTGKKWGTARAFFEFAERSRFDFYPFIDVGFWGKVFQAYDPGIFKARVF